MDRAKIEMKKTEMFTKAQEIVAECAAEVAVIIISSDGKKIYKFASSDMKKILAKCLEADDLPTFEFKPETRKQEHEKLVPEGIDVLKEEAQILKQKQLKVLGKDLTGMDLNELIVLEEQLRDGMLCIMDRKAQIFINQLLQSRIQVEELQGFLRSSKTERNVRPANKEFLLSTSFAAPLATNKGPEMELSFGPEVQVFFPSTSSAAPLTTDNGQSNCESSDKDSDTSLSLVGWLQNEESGK